MTAPAPKPEHVAAARELLRKVRRPDPDEYDLTVVAQALADAEARGAKAVHIAVLAFLDEDSDADAHAAEVLVRIVDMCARALKAAREAVKP